MKKKTHRKIIGRVPRQQTHGYPYSDNDENSITQFLRSPEIESHDKTFIREATIIDGTPVSHYYYEETDQEYWNMDDFPNVAPPFDNLCFFFDAPNKIVSKVYGTKDISHYALKGWLVTFEYASINNTRIDFSDKQVRANMLLTLPRTLKLSSEEIKVMFEGREHIVRQAFSREKTEEIEQLPEREMLTLMMYVFLSSLDILSRAGKWEDVEHTINTFSQIGIDTHNLKWELVAKVFVKTQTEEGVRCYGPLWREHFMISPTGEIVSPKKGDTIKPIALMGYLQEQYEALPYHERKGFIRRVCDEFSPRIHPALLAVSFMHCKNVTVERAGPGTCKQHVSPTRHTPTYHTINIHPMKEVLRKEGNIEQTGVKKALHICRGHFAHYGEDNKLFGKVTGTFWIPQHLRGSKEIGVSRANYKVNP